MSLTSGSTLIDVAETVEQVVARAREEGRVAIDTELVWERTYYPRLALIQIAFSEDEWYLIDASVPETLPPLGPLIADPAIVKILHDAAQDLAILRRATGESPKSVFDTRVAAGFAGLSSTTSLSGLLQELLEIELAKTETRTDWFIRPLSDDQLDYAADDVRYLARARDILLSRAEERGVQQWLTEELGQLNEPGLYANGTRGCSSSASRDGAASSAASWLCCASWRPGERKRPGSRICHGAASPRTSFCC